MADVVGTWSEGRAVAALEVAADALGAWREAGTLRALQTSHGSYVYPVSQFQERDGKVEVKPALVPVLRALHEFDPGAVAVLLHTMAPELDGATPLGWLADGGSPEALARLAGTVARKWAGAIPS